MSVTLQIGNQVFEYPENLENPGWGEDATAWANAVTERLKTLQGSNDIIITNSALLNNQSTPVSIPGLVFNMGEVLQMRIEYYIKRVYNGTSSVVTETGVILGHFDGTNLDITQESSEDSTGIDISVDATGQFKYTSTNLTGFSSGLMIFKATTFNT